MPAGILENDVGFVYGTTWHKMPQYVQLDRAVKYSEAEFTFDYPLKKVPLYYINEQGEQIETGCHGIIRTDKNILLSNGFSVGNRFYIENNLVLLRQIKEKILDAYPDLIIESVGTLFNGQTNFISLKINEHTVRGDDSNTETNLLYCNPLGRGSYLAYCHNIRVVCSNTLQLSRMQGIANKTLMKFSHTIGAKDKITDYMVDLSEVFLGLKTHNESLDHLATMPVLQPYVNDFMDEFFPVEGKEGRGLTMATNARESFQSVFARQGEHMTKETAESRYGLLQAYTEYTDHEKSVRGTTDDAMVRWDGITGTRARDKSKAFEYLLTV